MLISATGFINYDAPNGDAWRIEAGREMLADFGISGPDDEVLVQVVRWHQVMSGHPELWTIVCRLFAVTPMVGVEDPEFFRPWGFEDIAASMSTAAVPVSTADVEHIFGKAKEFWKKVQVSTAPRETPPPPVERAVATDVEKLLSINGFVGVDNERERDFIAGRISDLESLLDNETQRWMARSLIAQEAVIVFTLEPSIRSLQAQIKERQDKHAISKEMEERLTRMVASRNAAQSQIEATMKALNLSEAQTGSVQKKGAFKDSLSALIEAVALYEARGDTSLIDGVFTAAEIEVLTTPYESRDFQYRPDLALVVPECIENLFDPGYSPTPLQRKAHRRLLAGFRQGLALARSEAGEQLAELDPESVEDRNEAMISQAEREDSTAVTSAGLNAAASRAPAPAPVAPVRRADRQAEY